MRPSHLLLALAAAYLLLISLKFRRVLDLAATDLADDPAAAAAFSSPSSADHLPPPGSASATSSAPFPVRPFWHRYDRVSLPDLASRNRSALDRMADDAWRSASPPGRTPLPSRGTPRRCSSRLQLLCLHFRRRLLHGACCRELRRPQRWCRGITEASVLAMTRCESKGADF